MTQAVVLGEALVDLISAPDGSLTVHPGGGPYNVARTAARLGSSVRWVGRLSTDRFGQLLLDRLASDGVDVAGVLRTDDPTSLAVADIGPTGSATYSFYMQGTSVPGLRAADVTALMPADIGALYVGTLGLVLQPLADTSVGVVKDMAGRVPVLVDPNIRARLIDDRGDYVRRLHEVLEHAHVVKVSDEDMSWIAPDTDPVVAARGLLDRGPEMVVVTLGARGAIALTSGFDVEVPGMAVKVVDTVGAGDALAGSLLRRLTEHGRSWISDRDTVRAYVHEACVVAALTVTVAGAEPPTAARLSEFM